MEMSIWSVCISTIGCLKKGILVTLLKSYQKWKKLNKCCMHDSHKHFSYGCEMAMENEL